MDDSKNEHSIVEMLDDAELLEVDPASLEQPAGVGSRLGPPPLPNPATVGTTTPVAPALPPVRPLDGLRARLSSPRSPVEATLAATPPPPIAASKDGFEDGWFDEPAPTPAAPAPAPPPKAAQRPSVPAIRAPAKLEAQPAKAVKPDAEKSGLVAKPSRPATQPDVVSPAPVEAARVDTGPVSLDERLIREVSALATAFPTRAALVQVWRSRVALDVRGDVAAAEALCAQAQALAPDARFVPLTRRWIAGVKGDHAAVLVAARAELPLAGDAAERVALLWQIAASEPPASAEQTLRLILDLDPEDLGAWLSLASAAMQQRSWAVVAEAWEGAAQRTSDVVARAAFYASAAGVRDGFLADDDGARKALERALEADPASAAAHSALEAVHLRTRALADHARRAALEAERVGDLDPALGYHERAGDLLSESIGDSGAAARSYEQASALALADVVPLGKLASLYEHARRYPQLASIYERLLDRLQDPVRRGAVLLRLGTLYETRLAQPAEAIACYRAALDAVPSLAPAAQALARLYEATQRWADAAQVLLGEVDRLSDPALRAARYVAIAELLEAHQGANPQVVALHERALMLDPSQAAALDALDRLHRATGRWDEIITLHETQLADAAHPMRVRALRLALAALYHERAAAPEKAADQLRLALAGPADQFFITVSLARALADAGKWAEHVAVLETQAKLLGDGLELVATLYRIATVVETRLGDPVRALDAYHRVLDSHPRHELALQAILRLHLGQSRWEDVIASERRLLELIERPEEAAVILHRIAHVAEDHLAQPDAAITAYEEALRYVPSYRPARVALERLLRTLGRFERLATLLCDQAAVGSIGGTDRARLLCQAALVRELHPEIKSGSAHELYEEAVALDPAMPAALWGLHRHAIRVADWKSAAMTLGLLIDRATHATTRARLLVQRARVYELHLTDVNQAALLYEEALALDNDPAIVLERVRAALARTGGDAIRWLDAAANVTTDEQLASGVLRVRASMLEQGNQREATAEAYAIALHHGSSPQVIEGLARNRTGAPLAAALGLRARQLKDAPTRALLHAVAGALHEPGAAAHAAYTEALAAQPEFLPALHGLRDLAIHAGDWRKAAALGAQMATVAHHPHNKVELFEDAAAVFVDKLQDAGAAIALYRDVLAAAPGRLVALERALELLERGGDWGDAAALIAEQLGAVTDEATRASLLARRARILAERLGDFDGAIGDLDRALVLRPGNPELLTLLASLHESLRHWADATRVYEQLAQCGEPDDRCAALLAQARIWTVEVPDYVRAQRILEAARDLVPTNRTTSARLAEVASLAGDTRRAAELYADLATHGPALDRAVALLACVDLRRQLGGSPAIDEIAPAFELALEDPAVIPMLEDHYRVHDDLAAYITHAEAALTRMPTAVAAVPLRVSMGKMFGRELAAPERALPYLHAAVVASPDDVRLRITLAAALATRDESAAIAELRRAIELEPTNPIAYQRLAESCARLGWEIAASLARTAAALVGDDDAAAQAFAPSTMPAPVAGSLPPDDALALLVGPTRVPDVRRVVAQLDPYLHLVFPDHQDQLREVAPLPDRYPIFGAIRSIAQALAIASLPLYWRERIEPVLLASEPRAFVLAPEHVQEAVGTRIRFDAGYAIARLAGGSLLGQAVPFEQVQALLVTITDPDADDEHGFRRRLGQALPRRARKELERVVGEIGTIDARACSTWEQEERRRALGVGVIVCGDLRAVARALCPDAFTATADVRRTRLRGNTAIVDALRFAMSDPCWSVIRRLYGRA